MKLKKILALVLALMLTMSAFAFAETAEEPAAEETAAAEEAVDTADAAAEEEVPEHDYEVITDPVVATVGDVEIHVSDCMPRFMNYYQTLAQYANYGIDVSNYITSIKQTVLSEMVQMEIEKVKVKELGYDQFTEEELAEIEADAEATYNEMYLYYYDYFTYNAEPGSDVATMTTEYLEQYNYSKEDVLERAKNSFATNKMALDLTKDVAVTDEDLTSYYDSCVAADTEEYHMHYDAYESARTYGTDTAICYNPDGYRRVLQVLIGFDEETQAKYADLQSQMDALLNPEAAETAADAETDETAEPALTAEEILDQMDAYTAPLYEIASEVTEKFNNGTPIEELIAEYNADEGMPAEGYYVHNQSAIWDEAFVDAAFSVTEKGQLSAPYAGMYGLYMVYYLDDVPAGPVALDDVREILEPECYDILVREAYFAKLSEWRDEMNVETNIDFFITGYEG